MPTVGEPGILSKWSSSYPIITTTVDSALLLANSGQVKYLLKVCLYRVPPHPQVFLEIVNYSQTSYAYLPSNHISAGETLQFPLFSFPGRKTSSSSSSSSLCNATREGFSLLYESIRVFSLFFTFFNPKKFEQLLEYLWTSSPPCLLFQLTSSLSLSKDLSSK